MLCKVNLIGVRFFGRLTCVLLMHACFAGGDEIQDLRRAFANPPNDSRIMMRWWWFGGAVSQPELERELRAMKAAGIGGVEIQPVYPVALDDPQSGFRTGHIFRKIS